MKYSGFCVANGIVALATKVVYAGDLIKKCRFWPKGVPGNLVGRNFAYKEVGGVDILEDATEDGRPFHIFCSKKPDYIMKIMASWMTLDDLEGPVRRATTKVGVASP